jgi:hypothetical protein
VENAEREREEGVSHLDRHYETVASLGCLVCKRIGQGYQAAQLHHVAEGSGKRSDWSVVPLCEPHHDPNRTGSGFHGMGTKKFCTAFRVPGESEYGLLIWLLEDLARAR